MFYHPPLYYFFEATLQLLLSPLTLARGTVLFWHQASSFLLSSVTLLILFKLLERLKLSKKQVVVASAVVAFWPGLVLFSGRINNDVLLQVFIAALLCSLVRWLSSESIRDWLLVTVLFCLGFLTKTSMLLLAPLIAFVGIWKLRNSFRKTVVTLGLVPIVFAVCCGWYLAARGVSDEGLKLSGNIEDLDQGLLVSDDLTKMFSFSAKSFLEQPFASSRDVSLRRNSLPEYWMRSSVFGEFQLESRFHWVGRGVILSIFLMVLIALWNAMVALRAGPEDTAVFMLLLIGVVAFGHSIYRYCVPYSCAQDFRYTWFLIISFAYFFAQPAGSSTSGKYIIPSVLALFSLSSSVLIAVSTQSSFPIW
jgi:4-amino-4-deoxy-L-arabinose transferase-like glycosyltransferase